MEKKIITKRIVGIMIVAFSLFLMNMCFFAGCGGVKVQSILVKANEYAKTTYYAGEYFSLQGIEVVAKMNDGSQKVLEFSQSEDGFTFDKYKKVLTALDEKVVFEHKGKTASLSITVLKRQVQAPDENEITFSISTTSIAILNLQNAEARMGQGQWQDSMTFGGLLPGRTYTIEVRYKETEFTFASTVTTIQVATNKLLQQAVAEQDFIVSVQGNVVTISQIENAEYKLDDGQWTDSNVFVNVSNGDHNVSIRMKENQNYNASVATTKVVYVG